jgi:predicted DNA-binding antitoxin AbrB/MazE fold protein
MTTVLAVYEGGLLRPLEPLALSEGQAVQLMVNTCPPFLPLRPPTPEEEAYDRRLKAAPTLEAMFAVMATAPPTPDDGYDVLQQINESRRLTGFRMPDPGPVGEESR